MSIAYALCSSYVSAGTIGVIVWLLSHNNDNERLWPLYTVAWPLGLLVLVVWCFKLFWTTLKGVLGRS
jgi:hypothetical protein